MNLRWLMSKVPKRLLSRMRPIRMRPPSEVVDDVATRGREILRKRIESRSSGAAAAEVSWGKLAVMLAAIVGVIAVAAMLRG